MSDIGTRRWTEPRPRRSTAARPLLAGAACVGIAVLLWYGVAGNGGHPAMPPAPPPPAVTVSTPLVRAIPTERRFLGQFSAVNNVELRAQVGGTLTAIDFRDGTIVHKGDLLFTIDPRPYEIRLANATATLRTASARAALATAELWRAQQLKKTDFGTAETVDERVSEQREAQAAIDSAQASVRDAALDLEYARVVAPFTGRIGAHLASVGSLVSGSRAGASATTLLATLVSLDPIHLDFDMSESDFLAFQRARAAAGSGGDRVADRVDVSVGDDDRFTRHGTLDFVDNVLDRASGTIHARATLPNPDLFLVPGEFARLRLAIAPPKPAMLVPDGAVILDQSQHLVMTVAPNGTVVPKPVQTGELRGGLRVIVAGLAPTDRVIVDGLMHAMPGSRVDPHQGVIRFAAAAAD